MGDRLDRDRVMQQITDTVNAVDAPEIFGDKTPEQKRYDTISGLILNAVTALKQNPEFMKRVFEHYFNPTTATKPILTINIGRTRFDISYSKGMPLSEENEDEDLVLIRNKSEKVNLHTYTYPDGTKNAIVKYSEDAPNFVKPKYEDDPTGEKATEEATRLIKELKLAAK